MNKGAGEVEAPGFYPTQHSSTECVAGLSDMYRPRARRRQNEGWIKSQSGQRMGDEGSGPHAGPAHEAGHASPIASWCVCPAIYSVYGMRGHEGCTLNRGIALR